MCSAFVFAHGLKNEVYSCVARLFFARAVYSYVARLFWLAPDCTVSAGLNES